MASQTRPSPGVLSVSRLGPCHRQENSDGKRDPTSMCPAHGPSKLACASSRPEHSRNNAPASTRRQPDPPDAHGPPEPPPSSRTMLRPLRPQSQQPVRQEGGDGQALPDGPPPGDARRFSFFDFPPEIRNMIYDCSLRWPDCAELYRSYYKRAASARARGQGWHRAHLRTPTILLLCRRITDESMPVLRARWLVVDRLPPCMAPMPDGGGGFLRVSDFIGRETLQRLHYIDLRVGLGEGPLGSGWTWNKVLDELLGILKERNALVHFRLLIRRCNQEDSPSTWMMEMTEEMRIRRVCLCLPPARPPHALFSMLLTRERK